MLLFWDVFFVVFGGIFGFVLLVYTHMLFQMKKNVIIYFKLTFIKLLE